MKIVHLIDELRVGGTQTHLLTVLTAMRKVRDYEHELWCMFEDNVMGDRFRALGIPVKLLDLRQLVAGRRYIQARKQVERELEVSRPDVIEAHLSWSRLIGLWAAARQKVPVRLGFERGDLYMAHWKFRLANFINQLCADAIVVPSIAHGEWSRKAFGFSRTRLRTIVNCIDTDRFSPQTAKPREADWPSTRTLFIGAGTLGRASDKHFDLVLKAVLEARRLGADVGLVIAGDGKKRDELEQLIDTLDLRPYARILGMRSDIPSVMASCDVFCHARPHEALGNVALEAQASGLPVVVPASGGMQELVEDGQTGFLYTPLAHLELAGLMVRLDANPDERRAVGARARLAALKHSPVEYVEAMDRLYRDPRHGMPA